MILMSIYHFVCFLLFLTLCQGVAPPPPIDGLLPNGNFEQVPREYDMEGRQIIGAYSLPHWRIEGHVELVSDDGPEPGGFPFPVPEGVHAVRLVNYASYITQSVNVTQGLAYSLTFRVTKSCAQDENIIVSASGQGEELPIQTLLRSDGGDTYAWAFRARFSTVGVTFVNSGYRNNLTCGPLLMAVAIKELGPPIPTPDEGNLVRNGGFEIGPHMASFPNGALLLESFASPTPLPGWDIILSPKPVKYIDIRRFKVPAGLAAVELLAGSKIAQSIPTSPSVYYYLSFRVGDAQNDCHGSMMVQATADTSVFKFAFESRGEGGFKTGTFSFLANDFHTQVSFSSVFNHTKLHNSEHPCGPVLDDVSVHLAQ